jgi:hypothetical protein
MRIHGMGDKAQKAHIRAIKHFARVFEEVSGYGDARRFTRLSVAYD